ncbi:hypothetical protein [Cohnella soli]|uniref:DUF4259 domain-containing protein n=1 Tax=Cohnella soli TaxID=425005 RepID=A0ABW0HMK5_9BACL
MGAWGPELLENDTSLDASCMFKEHIQNGHTPDRATQMTTSYWKHLRSRKDDKTYVYIGIAMAQLELNCLTEHVRKTVIGLIKSGGSLEGWFSEHDARRRKRVLLVLRNRLDNMKGI